MARTPRRGHAHPSPRHFPDREELEVSALSLATDDELVVTAHGYERLCAELEALRTVQRAELTEQLRAARADGDSDNPILFDLLEEQAQLERRIGVLEAQVAAVRVATPAADGTAGIGSCVRVRHWGSGDVADYDLVGPIESDVGNGRVSVEAPVGRALVGRRRGETVVVETPRGRQELEILAVAPARAKEAA
jgi:transcription elongation factor GreA